MNSFFSKNKNFIFSIVITAVVFFAFYKLLFCYFHEDDFGAFSWAIKSESHKNLILDSWTGYFRLGENIFFVLYNRAFGLNPVPAYFFSIIVQISSAILVYFLASILTKNRNIGLISGLLFGAGYMHGETVSYLAPMTQGGFLGVFWLVSILMFIRYLVRGDRRAYLCSLLAFVLSLMVKEAAVLLIPVLFLYDVMFAPRGRKGKIVAFIPRYLPFLVVIAVYKLFFMVSLPMGGLGAPAMQALHSGGFSSFAFACLHILLSNMALLIIPSPLLNRLLPEFSWPFVSIAFILLVISAIYFARRDKRYTIPLWYALFWIIINLTPYSLLWPLKGYEGGRYLFISSIGSSIIIAMLVYKGCIMVRKLLKPEGLAVIFSGCMLTAIIGGILLYNVRLLHGYENRYIRDGDIKKEVIKNFYSCYDRFPENSILYLEGDRLPFKELVIPWGILSVVYHNRGGGTLRKERDFEEVLSLLARKEYSISRLFALSYHGDTKRVEDKTEKLRSILMNGRIKDYGFNGEAGSAVSSWKASNPYRIGNGYLSTGSQEKTVRLKGFPDSLVLGMNPVICGQAGPLPAIIPYQVEIRMRVSPQKLDRSKFPYLKLPSRSPYSSEESSPSEIDISRISHFYPDSFERLIMKTIPFKVSASSLHLNGEDPKHQVYHLNDRKYGDGYSWLAGSGVFPQWIKLDMGQERIVKGIFWSRDRTRQENDRFPRDYNLLVSPDGMKWMKVKVVEGNITKAGEIKVDVFEPVRTRYIKMEIYSTSTGNAPCLDEIGVIGDRFLLDYEHYRKEDKFESVMEYKNAQKEFRLHSVPYSSSDVDARCSLKNVLDGRYGDESLWIPFFFVGGSWIKIELQDKKLVNRVIWSSDRTGRYKDRVPVDYTIQTSLNGRDWSVVKTVHGDDHTSRGNYKVDDFEPVEARYVKMKITKIKGGFWAPAIDEFEVVEAKFGYIEDFDKLEKKFNTPFVFVPCSEEAEKMYDAIGTRGKAEISLLVYGDNNLYKKSSKEFKIIMDNKFRIYRIEINVKGLINDKIEQLKLSFPDMPVNVNIDYIRINPQILAFQERNMQ